MQRSASKPDQSEEPTQWYEDQVEDSAAQDLSEFPDARGDGTVEVVVSQNPDQSPEAGRGAEGSKGLFNCKICGKSFAFIDEATVHLLKTHCVILNECPYCQATSGDQSSLQIHIDYTHRKGGRVTEDDSGNTGPVVPGCVWCQKQLKHDGYCMIKKQVGGDGGNS